MHNEAVIVKLTNGDLFMATYIRETDKHIVFENPVTIKVVAIPGQGGVVEKTITAPFCSLTKEKEFSFRHDHVLYMKLLHSNIKGYYFKLIEAFQTDETELEEMNPLYEKDSEEPEEDSDDQHEDQSTSGFVIIPDTKTIH